MERTFQAFRIDTEYYENKQMKKGWTVLGQYKDNKRWEQLAINIKERNDAVKTMRILFSIHGNTKAIMYDEYGYGIDE